MLIVVHYCYRFLCTVVTDSCALLLPFFVHSPYHFLCTRDFCLHHPLSVHVPILCLYVPGGAFLSGLAVGRSSICRKYFPGMGDVESVR